MAYKPFTIHPQWVQIPGKAMGYQITSGDSLPLFKGEKW